MEVTFYKMTEKRGTYWEAVRGKRTRVPGTTMALGRGGLPHDLTQLVVEAAAGIEDGFWGSVADGATFKSTGRKRTKPGRAIIAKNRRGLVAAEAETGRQVRAWAAGHRTPVTEQLARFDRLWAEVADEGQITVEWPTLRVKTPAGQP